MGGGPDRGDRWDLHTVERVQRGDTFRIAERGFRLQRRLDVAGSKHCTATATNLRIPANTPILFGVQPGMKVSAISNT